MTKNEFVRLKSFMSLHNDCLNWSFNITMYPNTTLDYRKSKHWINHNNGTKIPLSKVLEGTKIFDIPFKRIQRISLYVTTPLYRFSF